MNNSFDVVVIGSGFGGSVSALRLREKGYSVAVLEGLEVALNRKKYTSTKRVGKLTGEVEAHLITLCCSTPPTGRSRWTLKLLADKLVELEIIDEVSSTTIQRTLKKTNLSLG